jgi:hypothetical protein
MNEHLSGRNVLVLQSWRHFLFADTLEQKTWDGWKPEPASGQGEVSSQIAANPSPLR